MLKRLTNAKQFCEVMEKIIRDRQNMNKTTQVISYAFEPRLKHEMK
jgi:hypothetical protein